MRLDLIFSMRDIYRSIRSTRIGKPVLVKDVKVSREKNISRWVDRENLIYVLDEIESKTMHKDKGDR